MYYIVEFRDLTGDDGSWSGGVYMLHVIVVNCLYLILIDCTSQLLPSVVRKSQILSLN